MRPPIIALGAALLLPALPAAAHGDAAPFEGPLAAAVAEGSLTELEAHRLTLLAARAPERLPYGWEDLADDPPRCLTGTIRALQRGFEAFPPAEADELRALLAPPDPGGALLQSERFPLRVHYPDGVDRAVAEEALAIVERSWQVEVVEMGFHAPLPDGGLGGSDDLDVFILPGSGGAAAVGYEPNRATPWNDWSTYITLDPEDYGGPLLGVTLAHEFNHSCQAAYDWYETIVALESTATFIEDRVYDEVNDYYTYLDAYQQWPHEPVDYLGGTWAWTVYAAALFQHFIAERYGDDVVVEMWEGSKQRGYRNEPDFIDGLDAALARRGTSFTQAAREHAGWRYFIGSNDDGAHFEEGAAMGDANQVHLEGRFTTQALPRGEVLLHDPPAEAAANLFEINVLAAHRAQALAFTFRGDGRAHWAVDLYAIPVDGPTRVVEGAIDGAGGSLPLAGLAKVVVVVSNLGDGAHDPEDREWQGLPYDLTLELAPARSPLDGPRP